MEPEVSISRAKLVRWARMLNLLVVSADRIGSHYGEPRLEDLDREFGRWFREHDLFRDLADARAEVHDVLAPDSADGDDSLRAELGDLRYWRQPLD
jgi:hypothetical protein